MCDWSSHKTKRNVGNINNNFDKPTHAKASSLVSRRHPQATHTISKIDGFAFLSSNSRKKIASNEVLIFKILIFYRVIFTLLLLRFAGVRTSLALPAYRKRCSNMKISFAQAECLSENFQLRAENEFHWMEKETSFSACF